jgi:hypothetical protein
MVWLRLWKLMHSETRLRLSTRNFLHLLRLAQQLMAKLAWGAMKTRSDDFVRPSRRAVTDLLPWWTICDRSRTLTRPDSEVGLMWARTEGQSVRTKRSYARPVRKGDS